MRKVRFIVLHCTATVQTAKVESIQRYWKEKMGWKAPGYHWIIKPDGECVRLNDDENISNGVAGWNRASIHISYIGGVDEKNRPKDNRTPAQLTAMRDMVRSYMLKYPDAEVKGHRDFPRAKKACPSFDVKSWLVKAGLN